MSLVAYDIPVQQLLNEFILCTFSHITISCVLQEPNQSFVTVEQALADKHENLASSKHPTPLTAQTNSTKSQTALASSGGRADDKQYAADEPATAVSGYIKDLDARYESNDEGLIAAYRNLYRLGVSDSSTLRTIEAIKGSNKRIQSLMLQVNIPNIVSVIIVHACSVSYKVLPV